MRQEVGRAYEGTTCQHLYMARREYVRTYWYIYKARRIGTTGMYCIQPVGRYLSVNPTEIAFLYIGIIVLRFCREDKKTKFGKWLLDSAGENY